VSDTIRVVGAAIFSMYMAWCERWKPPTPM
jgi:hypothetical protein